MRKKWFYVDITTTCRERVAVKAEDEEAAKDIASALVFSRGLINYSIAVVDAGYKKPPHAMRKFDGLRREVK